MHVQSLLFKRPGWTVERAKAWAKSHGYKYGSVDVTAQHIRLRQEDPSHFRVKRTIRFGRGIQAVVGRDTPTTANEGRGMARRKRNRKGQFMKSGSASAPRRRRRRKARAAAPAPVAAAPRRRRRRARTTTVAAAPRRRRRRHHRRRHHRRARAAAPVYATAHRRRRRHARSNPMFGGELALAIIAGGLGFVLADFADRYVATYDPSSTSAAPTDRFTGGTNGTLANTLNIASPPSIMRIGVGAGVTLLPFVGAYVVKNRMGKAALQGMGIGAGVKLFSTLWNAYVMGNLLKPAGSDQATMQASLGARLYPAEVVAAQNLAQSPPAYTAPQGLNAPPRGQLAGGMRDVGPFAGVAQPAPAPAPGPTPPATTAPTVTPQGQNPPGSNPQAGCCDDGCLGGVPVRYAAFMSE